LDDRLTREEAEKREAAQREAESEDVSDAAPRFDTIPALRDVSPEQMKDVLRRATAYAIKRSNREVGPMILSRVLAKLTTTRKWDPTKTTLLGHVLGCVKSDISHHFESKKPAEEAESHEAFHYEMRPLKVASPEQIAIDREEADERRAPALAVIEQLKERIAGHPLMPRVLERMLDAEGEETPRAMSEAFGVPVQQVYRAIEGIKYHARRIREEADPGESEESP